GCYRRAEAHWERRHEVRARSEGPWKRGVGMASQIWYGGGGPPSYAWIRIGADARAVVVTAMQDIGTGTRTAMAQIAAEELGLPLERVRCELGDSARGPYASISAGSSTTPSMGPAVRAAAADAARQLLEIAAQRFPLAQPGRGRDHPGHRAHALGGPARRSGERQGADADARRLQAADDRRRPGDRHRPARHPGRAPDQPRLEGPRRAADRADGRGDRQRDPRRDRRGGARTAREPRGDAARPGRGAEAGEASSSGGRRA